MWCIDQDDSTITHSVTGMTISFEGEPETSWFIGKPANIPRELSAIEAVQLVRQGFDFYRDHFQKKKTSDSRARPVLCLRMR